MPVAHADLVQVLRRMLEAGADGRLPPERELAVQLGAARNTVRRALAVLATEGHLRRERKLGTRLRHPGRPALAPGGALYLGEPEAHFHRDVVGGLRAGLAEAGLPLAILDHRQAAPDAVRAAVAAAGAVVGDGQACDTLAVPAGTLLIHADLWPSARQDCIRLQVDFLRASALACEHLIALGHARIAFIGPVPQAGEDGDLHIAHPLTEWMQGWRWAMSRHVLRGPTLGVDYEDPRMERRIARFLQRHRPTAVVTEADFRARQVEAAAASIGVRVPRDLSLTGLGSTPWVERGLGLATVDLGGAAMGRLAAQCILQQTEPLALRLQPTLVPGPSAIAAR